MIHEENQILITIVKKSFTFYSQILGCFLPILFSLEFEAFVSTGGNWYLSGMKFKENKRRYDNYLGKITNTLTRKD